MSESAILNEAASGIRTLAVGQQNAVSSGIDWIGLWNGRGSSAAVWVLSFLVVSELAATKLFRLLRKVSR